MQVLCVCVLLLGQCHSCSDADRSPHFVKILHFTLMVSGLRSELKTPWARGESDERPYMFFFPVRWSMWSQRQCKNTIFQAVNGAFSCLWAPREGNCHWGHILHTTNSKTYQDLYNNILSLYFPISCRKTWGFCTQPFWQKHFLNCCCDLIIYPTEKPKHQGPGHTRFLVLFLLSLRLMLVQKKEVVQSLEFSFFFFV